MRGTLSTGVASPGPASIWNLFTGIPRRGAHRLRGMPRGVGPRSHALLSCPSWSNRAPLLPARQTPTGRPPPSPRPLPVKAWSPRGRPSVRPGSAASPWVFAWRRRCHSLAVATRRRLRPGVVTRSFTRSCSAHAFLSGLFSMYSKSTRTTRQGQPHRLRGPPRRLPSTSGRGLRAGAGACQGIRPPASRRRTNTARHSLGTSQVHLIDTSGTSPVNVRYSTCTERLQ